MKIKKKKQILITTLVMTMLLIIAFPFIQGNTKAQFDSFTQTPIKDPKPLLVRGQPYNEILIVYRYFDKLKAGVYNDIGKPLISEEEFSKIDPEAIKKEFKAMTVIMNGPRFWIMDEITGYYMGPENMISGYRMNQPGILNLSLKSLFNRSAYSVSAVTRKTTFTFKAGQKVYELINDKNEVFTMQSGSREIDKTLTIDDLDDLGTRLKLPKGWTYRVRILENDVTYHIDGTAYIIQDELRNSYQKNPS